MKIEIFTSLKWRCLYTWTLIQTRGKRTKENPPFILALSFVQRWSLLNFGIEVLRSAQEDAPINGAEPLSGRETYVRYFVKRYSIPGLTNRHVASSPIALANAVLCRMAPLPSVTYTRLRSQSLMTSQESMASVLLHHVSEFASARI